MKPSEPPCLGNKEGSAHDARYGEQARTDCERTVKRAPARPSKAEAELRSTVRRGAAEVGPQSTPPCTHPWPRTCACFRRPRMISRHRQPWVEPLPGRLMHTNVVGCGIFAAISGSSAATVATIGRIVIPELKARGYDENMAIGSLAGAGTLGLLIPPSIIMIVYGVAADVSIARLFVAGALPGVLLLILFSGYIAIWALLNPSRTPPREKITTLRQKLYAGRFLVPIVLLIVAVIGSIYSGVARPTEAAVLGVVGSLLLSLVGGSLSWSSFSASVAGALKTSCMIAFILASAAFLTVAMGLTGIPRAMAAWIGEAQLQPWQLLAVLTLLFIILGCFLDGISMVVLTASVILPSVKAAGIDLLWFGIFIVLVVETAQITPPVGFNLFVMQGLTGKDMFYIARAALPFFVLMVVMVVIIWAFPEIVSYLPNKMFKL